MPATGGRNEADIARVRLRATLLTAAAGALSVVVGLALVLVLIGLVEGVRRAWRWLRGRVRFRGVTLSALRHFVHCGSEVEPEGLVYPDTDGLSFEAEIAAPKRAGLPPFEITLELCRPHGQTWQTLRQQVAPAPGDKVKASFRVESLDELKRQSGAWKARLVLRQSRKLLGQRTFTIVTPGDLVADLEVVEAQLLAGDGSQYSPQQIIVPGIEDIVPYVRVRPRQYHPGKFAGMQLRLELVNQDTGATAGSQLFPLDMGGGEFVFRSVSQPVAGHSISDGPGRWEFRLDVEGVTIARFPFVIVTFDQAVEGLTLQAFELGAVSPSGRVHVAGHTECVEELQALCPVAKIKTRFPSRTTAYPFAVYVLADGRPVAAAEGRLVLAAESGELRPGEFTVPALSEDHRRTRVAFVLVVGRKKLGLREVLLTTEWRCADGAGLLVAPPSSDECDYDARYSRILEEFAETR